MPSRKSLAVALLLPLLFGMQASRAEEVPPRTVVVSGQGEVAAQPDLARITLGVEARRPSLEEARAEVAKAIDALLALTRSLKIDGKHVDSTRLQVQPEYSWNERDRKRVLLGYIVSRQVQVELHELEQLGPLLERAVDAGANQIGDPMLDSSRRKELERDALSRAVQDARLNAETLVGAAGAKLGAVRHLQASSAPIAPMYRGGMARADAMMASAAPEATYQTGEMKFTASVSAVYDLIPPP